MTEEIGKFAFRLFAVPNTIEGLGRLFDFGNSLEQYNYSKDENAADIEATRSDWLAVGQDMKNSLSQYGQQSSNS